MTYWLIILTGCMDFSTFLQLIKHHIPLAKTDQIVDIGGGAGEVLDLRRNELAIKAPGVCVEPSENTLRIATKKEGIVPVLSIAKKILAQKPDCYMKLLLLNGVSLFHFQRYMGNCEIHDT